MLRQDGAGSHVGLVSSPPVGVYLADVTVHLTRDTAASVCLAIAASQWVTQPRSQLVGLKSTLGSNECLQKLLS
jgi:glucose-6-phosphate dehydrogenase assembly protein OpcA